MAYSVSANTSDYGVQLGDGVQGKPCMLVCCVVPIENVVVLRVSVFQSGPQLFGGISVITISAKTP